VNRLLEKSILSELQYFKEYELFDDGDYTDLAYMLWNNYAFAMRKRRPDSELPFERFIIYLLNDDTVYYKYGNSYVIGKIVHDNFVPTHFSPAGLKESIDLIKQLRTFENVVFVVTEDLKNMLVKLGFTVMPVKIMKNFRDVEIEKFIVMSNWLYGIKNEIFNNLKDKTEEALDFIIKNYNSVKYSITKLIDMFKKTLSKNEYIDEQELMIDIDTIYKNG
jgi:hypothetical protein